ncbi:MAG TPA: efflux RND transporter periplasmic adaptor subunit [Polyangiaceae bacterium]
MTPSLPRHRIEIGAGVLAFLAGSLLALTSGCSSQAEAAALPEAAPVAVRTAVVDERPVPRAVVLTGTLLANREADVTSDAAGRVLATFIERGDAVAAGAPLARLDARAAALGSAEAAAAAASLRADDENKRLECERSERLFAQNAISRAEYDRASAACRAASHTLAAANARAGIAQKNLADALIRAPFSGVVVERGIEVGEYVAPGRAIATVVETSTLRVELAVPEAATGAAKAGGVVTFEVAAYPGREFSGVIGRLSPKLRTQSRDQLVEVEIDNASGALRPGMFAVARLAVGEDRLPSLPASAVVGRAPAERVFVVKDSRVEERVVSTGQRRGDRVAVKKGVAPGDVVVIGPAEGIRDGVRVQ